MSAEGALGREGLKRELCKTRGLFTFTMAGYWVSGPKLRLLNFVGLWVDKYLSAKARTRVRPASVLGAVFEEASLSDASPAFT